MDLSKHYQEFTDAVLHAFNDGQLKMLLQFELGVKLDDVVGPGPFSQRVFELIGWCDGEGKVDELFIAAWQKKPGNPKLKALASKLAGEIDAVQQQIIKELEAKKGIGADFENPEADAIRQVLTQNQTNGALQSLVVAAPHLQSGQDIVGWTDRLTAARRRVCSIAVNGQHMGTGFLIGADRIMTNSHVVPEGGNLTGWDVVFDFVKGTDRNSLPRYPLVKEFARSQPKEFDFSIFQLKESPSGNRGYFGAKSYLFDKVREPVSVLGYPNGDPLSFAYGVVFDNNSFFGRVAYTANTAPGSSGSPVFSENWDLVAIHHHGETNVNNHGIPMKSILAYLKEKNLVGLLEEA